MNTYEVRLERTATVVVQATDEYEAEVLAWEQATDWTDEVLEVEATDGH